MTLLKGIQVVFLLKNYTIFTVIDTPLNNAKYSDRFLGKIYIILLYTLSHVWVTAVSVLNG